MAGPTRIPAVADAVLTALFLAVLFLPLADAVFGLDPAPPVAEKRALAPLPRPPANVAELAAFPAAFEAHFDDHLGFRNSLLRLHGLATVRAFGVSPTPRVVIGKDGWLYMAEEVEYHRSDQPFTAVELAAWQHVLEGRRDWLARRGCRYLVAVAPNKSTIYPEHLPLSARRIGKTTRLEQLLEHLRVHSDVDVLDLRPALLAAKHGETLYFLTDSHWNNLGGFVGYQETLRAIGRWFPAVEPLARSSFRTRARSAPAMDLAEMLGSAGPAREDYSYLQRTFPRRARRARVEIPPGMAFAPLRDRLHATEIDDPALPRAVLFCDSFSAFWTTFVHEHFRRLVRFRSSYDVNPAALFEPVLLELEHPEVVISEFAERFLQDAPPDAADLEGEPR